MKDEASKSSSSSSLILPPSSLSYTLRGINTDYAAILDSITEKLSISREELAGYRVAVIGAGRHGRTAVAALARLRRDGRRLQPHDRSRRGAGRGVQRPDRQGRRGAHGKALRQLLRGLHQHHVSVGMHPNVDASPLGEKPPKFTPNARLRHDLQPAEDQAAPQAEAAGREDRSAASRCSSARRRRSSRRGPG